MLTDYLAMEDEEAKRLTPIANLFKQQLRSLGVDPRDTRPDEWLSRIDLTLLYPEFGVPTATTLMGTDCPRVNPIELLRFFSKVIIRLDPCDSEEEFRRLYFMKPRQLARLVHDGQFVVLRTARATEYQSFVDPIFELKHAPQNSRLLTIVSLLRSGGDLARSPVHLMEARLEALARGRWREHDVYASFSGNVKRLCAFGYDAITEALLNLETFATATTLAFHLNNLLCRRYTDAVGHFSCESGSRVADLRERMKSHALGIDLGEGSPDFFLREITGGQASSMELKPGTTWIGSTYRVELVGKELWELLNALILPMSTGITVRSAGTMGSPERRVGQILSDRHRDAVARYLWEARTRAATGEFEAAEIALAEVARLTQDSEDLTHHRGQAGHHIVRYGSLGLRKAISYIPLVGSLLSDLFDVGGAVVRDRRPDLPQRLSDYLGSLLERFLPKHATQDETVFPMLTWTAVRRSV